MVDKAPKAKLEVSAIRLGGFTGAVGQSMRGFVAQGPDKQDPVTKRAQVIGELVLTGAAVVVISCGLAQPRSIIPALAGNELSTVALF